MIEPGLFQFAIENATIVALSAPAPAGQSAQAFYFGKLPKEPALPAIVLHRVSSPNVNEVLDMPSTGLQAIRGRFQFNSFAQDAQPGAVLPGINPSGYLAAAALSRALRLQLMSVVGGELPDGTEIRDVRLNDEFDANYEQGGTGYLYVRVLDLTIEFQEQK